MTDRPATLAAFPMYDRPETRGAHDRLWALIRAALGYGPERLTRAYDDDLWGLWEHPGLLLGVSCGLPLRTRLRGKVALVGSLVNDLPGCPRGHYFSRIVICADAEPRPFAAYAGARLAYNQAHSQSGWAAAQNHAPLHGFAFADAVETGAHRESVRAVAEGRADIACIDAVSWALIAEHDGFARGVQVIGATEPTPGEPALTAAGGDVAALARAFAAGIDALSPEDRAALHLAGFADTAELPPAAYEAVPTPPAPPSLPGAPRAFGVASRPEMRPNFPEPRG